MRINLWWYLSKDEWEICGDTLVKMNEGGRNLNLLVQTSIIVSTICFFIFFQPQIRNIRESFMFIFFKLLFLDVTVETYPKKTYKLWKEKITKTYASIFEDI